MCTLREAIRTSTQFAPNRPELFYDRVTGGEFSFSEGLI